MQDTSQNTSDHPPVWDEDYAYVCVCPCVCVHVSHGWWRVCAPRDMTAGCGGMLGVGGWGCVGGCRAGEEGVCVETLRTFFFSSLGVAVLLSRTMECCPPAA